MKLREKMWLWGHPERRYNYEFGNDRESRMTPMEACLYLGVRNTFMSPVGWKVDRRQYNKSFITLKEVGWECYKAGETPDLINPIIEEARNFPNNGRVVFDDFKRQNRYGDYTKLKMEDLFEVNRRLHEDAPHPMSMWMVLYANEFGLGEEADAEFRRYIDPFDGVIMWGWLESKVKEQFHEKYEIFKKLTHDKRRMLGCYLYNFGESRQATPEIVLWQLDTYREKLLSGEIEGIVLHSNPMADLDYPAFEVAREWMLVHGDDEIVG